MTEVWIFNGDRNSLPSAVFSTRMEAEEWIEKNKLSGTLTEYPVGISIYDWAVSKDYFKPKDEFQKGARTIANFSSANLAHFHFEDGLEVG